MQPTNNLVLVTHDLPQGILLSTIRPRLDIFPQFVDYFADMRSGEEKLVRYCSRLMYEPITSEVFSVHEKLS